MKRILFHPALVVCAVGAITFASCKKSDDGGTKSRHDMIVGTWRTYQTGDDTNGNGAFDTNEQVNVDSASSTIVTFNSNGSGTANMPGLGTIAINWSLENNDTYLKTIIPGLDTVTAQILSLDDNYATVLDDITATGTDKSFTTFKKQQ